MKRQLKSGAVKRVADARLPTSFGQFRIVGYESPNTNHELVALVKGKLDRHRVTLVSIHSQCFFGDVFGSLKCDCGRSLRVALEMIEREGSGVVLYQQPTPRETNVNDQIESHRPLSASTNSGLRYQQCAEILDDLGVRRVRLVTTSPQALQVFAGTGLKVVDDVDSATVLPERNWKCPQPELTAVSAM